MIPDHVRERILVQLQNQLEYHRAKGVEIDEINDLMKIVEELE